MDDFGKDASKSLNTTITEIMSYLDDEGSRPGGNLRKGELRLFLHEKLADLAETWYRRGFNRGHKESRKHSGDVPRTLRYEGIRTLFLNQQRQVRLRSKVRRRQDR